MKKILMSWMLAVVSVGAGFAEVKDVTVEQAAAKLKKDPKIVVVDIRTPGEFAGGHLKGALNLDFNAEDFEKKLAKLDRKKTYLMHCMSGGRSTASIAVWDRLGFKNVLHLKAGAMGWKNQGQPVVMPKEEKEEAGEKSE